MYSVGVVNIDNISSRLPYDGRRLTLVDQHKLPDIITYLSRYHDAHKRAYDNISEDYWRESAARTAKELFDFLKANVRNVTEGEGVQTIKGPGRILADKHGDCKHYASFIHGVCDSLHRKGYPIASKFRFTSDTPQDEVHHVFAVVGDGTNDFWADPVLRNFNTRSNFYNVKDSNMLEYLSGTEYGEQQAVGKKNIFKQATQGIKKFTLKTAIAPARNSFLALVGLNAFNLAHRLYDTIQNPAQAAKLKHKWETMGGNWHKLTNTVNAGYKIYMKHHHKGQTWKKISGCHIGSTGEYVGVAPAIPALMAMATAIIAALKPYLKKDPQNDADMSNAGKAGGQQLMDNAADVQANGTIQNMAERAAGGGGGGAMNVSAGTNSEGEHVVQVNSADHPLIKNAGSPVTPVMEGEPVNQAPPIIPNAVEKRDVSGGTIIQKIEEGWRNHKGKILTVAGILLVIKVVSGNKVIRKKLGF